MKRILAVVTATVLLTICVAGCSPQAEKSEALVQSSASTEAINDTAKNEARAENAAQTSSERPVLDTSKDLEGMTYAVDSSWAVSGTGTTASYTAEVAADLPLIITVAALNADDVASSQDAGLSVSEMLVSALGVETSGSEADDFKGIPCEEFEGMSESGYNTEGYVIPGNDWTYIIMALSTNLDDDRVEDVWDAFLDTVTIP